MKRIICCCDGTWNKPHQTDNGVVTMTNVQKIFHLLSHRDQKGIAQLPYYHPGVGTSGNWWRRLMGGVAGEGLNANIIDAYRFVMLHYEEGDEIFLFGFSRGAYTARSLAGFIINCGILKSEYFEKLRYAFDFYRDRNDNTHPNSPLAVAFREKFSHPPAVYFIGVWDTVGDLGIPLQPFMFIDKNKYRFHDTQLSSQVRYAYHALAVDEHRAIFNATLWELSEKGKQLTNEQQTVEQKWFTGSHSNVGGGYQDTGLSDHTLKWMVTKATSAGLCFEPAPDGFYKIDEVNGCLRDSNSFWWRFLHFFVPFFRVIFKFDPVFINQHLAGSVYERASYNKGYAPPNIPAENALQIALSVGETATAIVEALPEYSGDVLLVNEGEVYQFLCAPGQQWKDWFIKSGPNGYFNPLALLYGLRLKTAKCFCLCGVFGRDNTSAFKIGASLELRAETTGVISFFANDCIGAYWNNSGSVALQIKRVR